MKEVIKKLLRESLVSEKLTIVDSDVDLLYNTYFKEDIDYINETGYINKGLFKRDKTDTNILKSEESTTANKINPCIILVNNLSGNMYRPSDSTISISVNHDAFNFVINSFKGDLNAAINNIDEALRNSLSKEFTEERIKGSIHHELAHWVDDTMNNGHIKKMLVKAQEFGHKNFGGVPINSTKMEIQGQIHNVKQLYNTFKDVWDDMSFNELISHSPSLILISKQLKGDVKNKWIRDLKSRMYREGLLGKNMINY